MQLPGYKWIRAEISGSSMEPTLSSRDYVIARCTQSAAGIRVGQVVLAYFMSRPELLVVKRVIRVGPQGLWLAGDNRDLSDASEKYGWAQPRAVVFARYWPRPRLIS